MLFSFYFFLFFSLGNIRIMIKKRETHCLVNRHRPLCKKGIHRKCIIGKKNIYLSCSREEIITEYFCDCKKLLRGTVRFLVIT